MFHRKNLNNKLYSVISLTYKSANVINLMYKVHKLQQKSSAYCNTISNILKMLKSSDFTKFVLTFFERGHISH